MVEPQSIKHRQKICHSFHLTGRLILCSFLSNSSPPFQDYCVYREILIRSLNIIFETMEVATFDYGKKRAIFGNSLHCIMSKDGHIWKLELLNQSINICQLVALNCCGRYFGFISHYMVSMKKGGYFEFLPIKL